MQIDYTTEIEKCKPILNRYVLGHGEKERLRAELLKCDADTVFTCQLIMFIGRDLSYAQQGNIKPYEHPEKALAGWAVGVPRVQDINKSGEISYLLEKTPLRQFLKCGMRALGMLQEAEHPVSFYDWTMQQWRKKDGSFKDNRFGDLAADMEYDDHFPQTCSDVDVLRGYFERACRCKEAWDTAKEALRKYCSAQRNNAHDQTEQDEHYSRVAVTLEGSPVPICKVCKAIENDHALSIVGHMVRSKDKKEAVNLMINVSQE